MRKLWRWPNSNQSGNSCKSGFGQKPMRILRWPGAKHSSKAGKKKNFLGNLSKSGPAVRLYREGRQPPGPKTVTGKGEIMPRYLVAIHLPDDFDPSAQPWEMERDIDALNEEMEAAGVRILAAMTQPLVSDLQYGRFYWHGWSG
jgi:hypothetical protein